MDKFDYYDDFMQNENLVADARLLEIGQLVYIMDDQIIDSETENYAIIPARVVAIEEGNIQGRWYYSFVADGSFDDEGLNDLYSPEINQNIYKILENTSPFILEKKDLED